MKIKTLLSLFLFFLFSVATSWAEDSYPEYITDIKLIGGTQDKVDNLLPAYKKSGWTIIEVNLNEGVKGSDFVFLIYKKGSRASTYGGFVTDLYLNAQPEHSDYPDGSQTKTITYGNHTYDRAPYDGDSDFYTYSGHLNAKAGGMNIHLYYTKQNFSDKRALTSITCNYSSSNGQNDKVLYWWNNLKDHPANVNIGNNGSAIYIHVTTATMKNRPLSDPVMATGLVYNGQPQKLIKTAATISSGTMFYKVGSGDYIWHSSNVTATEAGNHTVSYYAGANDYGDASDVFSQTVTIAKSPNSSASIPETSTLYSDETLPLPVANNLSTGTITYKYSTSQNGTYSTTKPVSSGTYWVKAEIAGDDNCNSYTTAAKSFRFVGWTGSGTSAKPYIINSTDELDLLAIRVNNGNTYNGAYFELGANITYVPIDSDKDGEYESNFTPIGNEKHYFKGNFDGKGHTVSGVVVKVGNNAGLFGKASGSASIKNLTIANSLIEGFYYVGGIVGSTDNSNVVIENCHISQDSVKGSYYVGGIVGVNYGNIRGSTSDATVSGREDIGGIVGINRGFVENSLYFGSSVTASINYYVGAIAGFVSGGGSFTNNYHTLKGMGGVGNANSATGEDTDKAKFAAPFTDEPAGIGDAGTPYGTGNYVGITPYTNGLKYKDKFYRIPWIGSGTESDPYIISSTEGLDLLAWKVNGGNDYDGKYFELGADIKYESKPLTIDLDGDGPNLSNFTPIGQQNTLFKGKFDGKGHTISGIVVKSSDNYVGLFGYVEGSASIKHLTLVNSSIEGNNYVGGIVGCIGLHVLVENCHVSDVRVKGHHLVGGITGRNWGKNKGCTSAAEVSGSGTVGGIVGENVGSVENSLYYGAAVTATINNYVGAISGDNGGSFSNSYHTLSGMGGVGNSESATGEDVDDAMLAKVVTEKPIDIGEAGTPYGTGEYVGITPYTRGLEYKGSFYYKPLWTGNGTAENPYIITSTEGLDLLAQKVNSGNDYENTYFELGADIKYESKPLTIDLDGDGPNLSNFTPIGKENAAFWGKFDGKGHTISGIVVKSSDNYVGLFGYVGSSVSIKNLTLANSSIEGYNGVGGIVGYVAYSSDTDPFVENCHVSANVLVKGSDRVGGITGINWGKIKGCTSAAEVSGRQAVGGIVGQSVPDYGSVENSLYYGTSVTATNYVGAISGDNGGSFSNNYHTLSGMGGVGNSESATGEDTDKAKFAAPFTDEPAGIGDAGTPYGSGNYVGITPYTNGLKYKGKFYRIPWIGSGTGTDPYIITSTEELDLLAQKVNNGNKYENTYFELGADIKYSPDNLTVDLDNNGENESNFTPIGDEDHYFSGQFDGKGHKVSGIVVKSSCDFVGLFGYVNGNSSSIKNLTIASSSFEGGFYSVGGIVGMLGDSEGKPGSNEAVIENCRVSGEVSVKGRFYVGGIVGQNNGKIKGSTSDAEVFGVDHVGGVVGNNYSGLVENCLYYGTSVTATENDHVGAIVGGNYGSLDNNYHTLENLGGIGAFQDATGKDTDGARKVVVLSAADGVTLTLAGKEVVYNVSGITVFEKDDKISSGILYDSKLYAGETEDVMLNLGYTVSDYEVLTGYTDGNDNALKANDDGTYTLTMRSAAATVTPAIKYLWGEGAKGTAENPYIISSTEGLDLLAQKVNSGNQYKNTYFELGADITYVPVDSDNNNEYDNNFTPIGFGNFEFYGKFDGKGHTVSGIVVNANQMGVGLFGHVAGSASIKNLTLAKSSFVSNQNNMGGIVGAVWNKDVIVENCHVSSDVSVKGANALGGIVGFNIGTISGSTSEAQVSGVQSVGGIVGSNLGVIENNLYLGTSVSATDKNKVGAIAGYVDRGHPDCKASFTNNYHTLDGMGGVGNSESATGEDTDDAMLAKVVTEKPTDIGKAGTPYGTDDYVGITPYTRGLEYKDHFYYKPLWKGNGTEDEPYIITSTEGLDKLASDVNSGNQYKNTYFELGADITYEPKNLTVDLDGDGPNLSNFTPIGNSSAGFGGKFDGKGHTVSGIVVESNSDYVGLFGYVGSSVSIKNLTLANSSIKGNNNVGGIVGYVAYSSDTDPFVENCHVSANVLVKGGQYVGGIAGYNSEKIIGCTSDANVSGNEYVGGIVGENGGLVKNSLYLGKSVTATKNSRVGAIAGYVSYEGSFTNNYHTLEGKGGEGNHTNMGSDTKGAKFAAPFSVEPAGIGTDETSYGTGDYVGITSYTNGLAYKGRYYYVGTLVEGYAAVQIFKDAEGKKHAIIDGEYDGPDAVKIEEDIDVTSVTFSREFTPNSGFATIMFPFDVNASSLTGVKSVIEFTGITKIDGNNAVGMGYVWCNATLGEQEGKVHPEQNCNNYSGELKAYTPYMIEMESATLGIDADAGVTLVKWREFDENNKRVGDAPVGNWVFRGALQKKEWPKGTGIINEGRLWAFAAAERSGAKIGEFVRFGGNNWANPFRAYLVECKDTGNGLDCSDEDSETQPSLVSKYRFADALAPTDTAEKSAGAAATDQSLVMRQAAASETASLNSMDIVIVYGDKDSESDKERPTVIGRFNPATGEIRMLPRTKQTYDLKGRKVGNGKKAKGAYYRR